MTSWKVIIEFPRYSVSNDGRVRNDRTGKILTPYPDTNGYLSVGLYRDGKRTTKRIHKLVADAFIPNPLNLHDTNHKDGNRTNNNVSNLEWTTRSGNMLHSYRTLGKKPRTSDRKAVLCVETNKAYPTIEDAAKDVRRSSMALRKCLKRLTKTCAGLHWRDVV